MKYTQIPADTFEKLQMNAGILLKDFDPTDGSFNSTDILGATTGGVNFQATPEYVDFGEDVDNCPKNVLELKKLNTWTAQMTGTLITIDADSAKSLVGAADAASGTITPRQDLKTADFDDLWLVGDYSDVNDGNGAGFVAIHMMNALSTGGFQLQTADRGKGQFAFTYLAHYSMAAQNTVPFAIHVHAGTN